eukprot:Rmarinus@m.12492
MSQDEAENHMSADVLDQHLSGIFQVYTEGGAAMEISQFRQFCMDANLISEELTASIADQIFSETADTDGLSFDAFYDALWRVARLHHSGENEALVFRQLLEYIVHVFMEEEIPPSPTPQQLSSRGGGDTARMRSTEEGLRQQLYEHFECVCDAASLDGVLDLRSFLEYCEVCGLYGPTLLKSDVEEIFKNTTKGLKSVRLDFESFEQALRAVATKKISAQARG